MPDLNQFQRMIQETQPDKLEDCSPEKLQDYLTYFLDAHHTFGDGMAHQIRAAEARIVYLQNEIGTRSLKIQSADQHRKTYGLGEQTLCWTKVAAWAAIAAVVATVFFGLIQIWRSSL